MSYLAKREFLNPCQLDHPVGWDNLDHNFPTCLDLRRDDLCHRQGWNTKPCARLNGLGPTYIYYGLHR